MRDAENLFSKYYGDLVKLKRARNAPSGSSKIRLQEAKDDNTFTLRDILQQMKAQLPEPYSVEENMLRKNLEKEAQIAPFFQAFEKVAEQLVPF